MEIGFEEISGGAPVLYVRDNGIGIPKKHHEAVFRIFKRLHGRDKYGGGTGAGLTIVKKIIERHHGEIWLESDVSQGTTFYFTLQGELDGDTYAAVHSSGRRQS
jgi:light-regulated signal transduction histidine kinase (bacteriophytochrome)